MFLFVSQYYGLSYPLIPVRLCIIRLYWYSGATMLPLWVRLKKCGPWGEKFGMWQFSEQLLISTREIMGVQNF